MCVTHPFMNHCRLLEPPPSFLVVIDISYYAVSASKRGKLKAHGIIAAQFVEGLT